eukprot:7705142-Alexandrium_andersonii.AAC.1
METSSWRAEEEDDEELDVGSAAAALVSKSESSKVVSEPLKLTRGSKAPWASNADSPTRLWF